MFKLLGKLFVLIALVCVTLWAVDLYQSKTALQEDIIRLHIIANSDSETDQSEKLKVRDGVLAYIQEEISKLPNREDAEDYIRGKLADIEDVANEILEEIGSGHIAKVKLGLTEFGERIYDTFSLPSGVYNALQIEIGEAEGKNWWCVVFPSFCVPTSNDDFRNVAASAGFDNDVIETISNDGDYKIRFFVLDLWGKVENFLFKR